MSGPEEAASKSDDSCAVYLCNFNFDKAADAVKTLGLTPGLTFGFDMEHPFQTLTCGHQIHTVCLERCLREREGCPLCRRPVQNSETDLKIRDLLRQARALYEARQFNAAITLVEAEFQRLENPTTEFLIAVTIVLAACDLRLGKYPMCIEMIERVLHPDALPRLSQLQLAEIGRLRANAELASKKISTEQFINRCSTACSVDSRPFYIDFCGNTKGIIIWTADEKEKRTKDIQDEIEARKKELIQGWRAECFF